MNHSAWQNVSPHKARYALTARLGCGDGEKGKPALFVLIRIKIPRPLDTLRLEFGHCRILKPLSQSSYRKS
ncbi:hypothetical protein ES707_14609 [subsurface metagenome]